ncbi:MAG: hypothetical protein KatS3mg111_3744 [Pirellulaceae bacterium]|nr:MAG: hypothetical protein KatS3mg111_3744 [Pirellulaceae bacterium]
MRTLIASPRFWMISLTLISAGFVNFVHGKPDDRANEQAQQQQQDVSSLLLREGTTIKSTNAQCRFNGERLVVDLQDQDRVLIALENLMAQRVVEALQLDPMDNRWSIEARVTEFNGRNFLFLVRAQRSPRTGLR